MAVIHNQNDIILTLKCREIYNFKKNLEKVRYSPMKTSIKILYSMLKKLEISYRFIFTCRKIKLAQIRLSIGWLDSKSCKNCVCSNKLLILFLKLRRFLKSICSLLSYVVILLKSMKVNSLKILSLLFVNLCLVGVKLILYFVIELAICILKNVRLAILKSMWIRIVVKIINYRTTLTMFKIKRKTIVRFKNSVIYVNNKINHIHF
jgi:hypothetical protein